MWNLSKLANLSVGGAVDAFKRPYIYSGELSHTLLGYRAQYGGHLGLVRRLSGYTLYVSADLFRYDASFPRWLTSLLLAGLAFYSGILLDFGIQSLLLFWLRSLCLCMLILADCRTFFKVQGLSSGHVAVSFVESIGAVALTYRFLLGIVCCARATFKQNHAIMNPQEVASSLHDLWDQFWMRDPASETENSETWQAFWEPSASAIDMEWGPQDLSVKPLDRKQAWKNHHA